LRLSGWRTREKILRQRLTDKAIFSVFSSMKTLFTKTLVAPFVSAFAPCKRAIIAFWPQLAPKQPHKTES
jgi:hypothetical protein